MTVNKQKILAGEASESLAYVADYTELLASTFYAATAAAGAVPTTPAESWGTLRDLGWISEDGLTTGRDYSTEDLPAYGTKQPVRTFVTTDTRTFAVNCLEHNGTSVSLYNQLPMTSGATGYVAHDATAIKIVAGAASENRAYSAVFDVLDPGRGKVRYLVPSAQVSEVGEIVYRGGQAAILPVTLTAQPVSVYQLNAGGTGTTGAAVGVASVIELVELGTGLVA